MNYIKRPQVNPCYMTNTEQCIAQVGSGDDLGGYLFVKSDGIIDGEVHWGWRVMDADMMQIAHAGEWSNNHIGTPLGLPKTPREVIEILAGFLFAMDDVQPQPRLQGLQPLYDWVNWNRDELEALMVDIEETYQLAD